ncbi:MAPEG family protein [soil metagenome]
MGTRMDTELPMLVLAVILGLVNVIWGAAAAQPQRGLAWNIGPRDEPKPLTGVAGRLERALANFLETFPFFAVAVIACYLKGKFSVTTEIAAIMYVAARALYLPLYAFGVPGVRSIAWAFSLVGIVMMIIAFFQ